MKEKAISLNGCIRLMSISHDFLLNELVKEELISTKVDCLNFMLAAVKGIFIPSDTECVTRPPRKCLESHREGIFVCGGREALCFIPQQNMWYQLSDMVLEHQDHAITQCRDKVYIFDEQRVGPGKSCVLEYYMHSCNSWGTVQATAMDLEEDINSFSTVSVLNGRLYAIGSYSGLIFIYHPEKNEWDLMKLPRYQCRTCGIADGRHPYIIGGSSSLTEPGSTTAKRLDPSAERWDDLAAMNEARHDAYGAAMNSRWNSKERYDLYSAEHM